MFRFTYVAGEGVHAGQFCKIVGSAQAAVSVLRILKASGAREIHISSRDFKRVYSEAALEELARVERTLDERSAPAT